MSRRNLHSNHHTHAELDEGITLLAPQCGSAVDSEGAKMRARTAPSLGVVRQKRGLNSACNYVTDVEFGLGITLLAPQWGSAVDFGGAKIRARFALSLELSARTVG